jgi:cytochrome P450
MLSRILLQHFPAIHTTGSILSAVINYLIEHPVHGERLRQEALNNLANPSEPKTWTTTEIAKLKYHDRFIAEILRLEPLLYAPSRRTCIRDGGFTFSDGTHIPHGFGVALATDQIHHDPRFWENPFQFNPDRWQDRTQVLPCAGESDYFAFGTGRHVWYV